jgi:hypothetical protein
MYYILKKKENAMYELLASCRKESAARQVYKDAVSRECDGQQATEIALVMEPNKATLRTHLWSEDFMKVLEKHRQMQKPTLETQKKLKGSEIKAAIGKIEAQGAYNEQLTRATLEQFKRKYLSGSYQICDTHNYVLRWKLCGKRTLLLCDKASKLTVKT